MSSTKKDNIIKIIENSNKLTESYIDNQKKQIENILSNLSYNSNKFNSKVCSNLINSSLFTLKIISKMKENQNKIINTVKETSNNYIELQKNVINLFQSVAYFPFFNLSLSSLSSLENFNIAERYFNTYNTINKNVLDDTTNIANVANQVLLSGIQNIIEITERTQKYYSDIFQYYFGTKKM